jgi:glycosyltransferase involved in cell wall biosynthesis
MIPEELGWDLSMPEWEAKQRAIKSAMAFVSVSQVTHDSFLALHPEKAQAKRLVAPLAIDSSVFKPAVTAAGVREYSFVFVGSRGGYKGGDTFFQSLPLICARRPIRIAMVGGEPPTQQERWALNACSFKSEIEYFGKYASDHQLAAVYSSSSALVYLSIREGFGLPVVEAMACGCPVMLLSSNQASIDVAGGTNSLAAYVVQTKDLLASTVAETALKALQDADDVELRGKISQAALARAKLFYRWEPFVEALAEVIAY